MSQVSDFQIYKYEAFQNVIIEDKINVEMPSVEDDMLLAGNKGKASAKLQQELLQVGNQRLFQIAFEKIIVRMEADEFKNIRIADNIP